MGDAISNDSFLIVSGSGFESTGPSQKRHLRSASWEKMFNLRRRSQHAGQRDVRRPTPHRAIEAVL